MRAVKLYLTLLCRYVSISCYGIIILMLPALAAAIGLLPSQTPVQQFRQASAISAGSIPSMDQIKTSAPAPVLAAQDDDIPANMTPVTTASATVYDSNTVNVGNNHQTSLNGATDSRLMASSPIGQSSSVAASNIQIMEAKVSTLDSAVDQLNQQLLLLQQQNNSRFEAWENKNNNLDKKIEDIGQQMVLLSQQLYKLSRQVGGMQQSLQPPSSALSTASSGNDQWVKIKYWLVADRYRTIIVCSLIILLIVFVKMFFQDDNRKSPTSVKKKRSSPQYQEPGNQINRQNQYDDMVAAKLDLARTYMAMEDYHSAYTAVQHVLGQGDVSQQQAAQELFHAIKQSPYFK